MQIPYETTARPDTGLYNAKLGIWLFLASEVMLFGGLFSGYLFLRLGAEDGYWPHGLLNVPVGTMNTGILIASSVTIVLTWANLKMRRWAAAQRYLLASIICGLIFLVVKLSYEYPDKYRHYGAFIKKESLAKYERFLGNEALKARGKVPRVEITGHLETVEVNYDPTVLPKMIQDRQNKLPEIETKLSEIDKKLAGGKEESGKIAGLKRERKNLKKERKTIEKELLELPKLKFETFLAEHHLVAEAGHDAAHPATVVKGHDPEHGPSPSVAEKLVRLPGVKPLAYEVEVDAVNASPTDPANERAQFWPRPRPGEAARKAGMSHHDMQEKGFVAKIDNADIQWGSAFEPKHSPYFAIYFTITGLHGAHVLGGVVVMAYFYFFGHAIYRKNPEHQANRIEVVGLFWHFVDLVWIFVFPIFYLL